MIPSFILRTDRARSQYIKKAILSLAIVFISAASFGSSAGKSETARSIKVLAIGNSFSEDAVENYLYNLAEVAGIRMTIGNMYIGGCSLETHRNNAKANAPAYVYRKIVNGAMTRTVNATLLSAIIDEDWDYISFQQVSNLSGVYGSYFPYLTDLLDYVQTHVTNPHVEYALHQTWAYAQNSSHAGFTNYGNDQMTMYTAIVTTVNQAAAAAGIHRIIPSGTAIQNGRSGFVGDNFCRDGHHLTIPLGRYTAACTWFEAITGENVVGNPATPEIPASEIRLAQHAAHCAVTNPNGITSMEDIAGEPPTNTTVYYVATDGSDAADGKSPAAAFATLAKAVEAAAENDEIRISAGTFLSTETCLIDKSLTIKGSFDETVKQEYTLPTVLSGQNSCKIMKVVEPFSGTPVHLQLDGICFTNGYAAGNGKGAAIEFVKSTAVISNCVFRQNAAGDAGGALAFSKTEQKSTISNTLFTGNTAKYGAALHAAQRSSLEIINCTIAQNACTETGAGGGIYTDGSLKLMNSIVWDNKKGADDNQIDGTGKYYLDHNILRGGVQVDNIDRQLQSNMVLQQNADVVISGRSIPGQAITVSCSWSTEAVYRTTAGADAGYWSVRVPTPAASFVPVTISVEGKARREFTNILIGEVWLCSGQSNMRLNVKNALNGDAEVAAADHYPNIRLLNLDPNQSTVPLNSFREKWQVCSSTTISGFSAAGYFFGRKLLQDLNVPIGLINASWGDTTCEVWLDRDSVMNCNDDAVIEGALRNDATPRSDPSTAYKIGSAYNAMIHPLRNIPVAGAIWYQGESNQGYPWYYPALLNVLVKNWRSIRNVAARDFPFYIAQICPFNRLHNFPTPYSNPAIRWMQFTASELIPNSGFECNDDLGETTDIHPKNKQDVGLRLAWTALYKTYGRTACADSISAGYASHTVDGNRIRIRFKNVGAGLKTKDGLPPSMFEICGDDKVFYPADAVIDGTDTVVISNNSAVPNPVAARLGWSYIKTSNLLNGANIPVSVFKTYNWADAQEEQ